MERHERLVDTLIPCVYRCFESACRLSEPPRRPPVGEDRSITLGIRVRPAHPFGQGAFRPARRERLLELPCEEPSKRKVRVRARQGLSITCHRGVVVAEIELVADADFARRSTNTSHSPYHGSVSRSRKISGSRAGLPFFVAVETCRENCIVEDEQVLFVEGRGCLEMRCSMVPCAVTLDDQSSAGDLVAAVRNPLDFWNFPTKPS